MEIKQVKNIVRQMVDNGAAEKEIDAFIAASGYTLDDVKNFKERSAGEKAVQTLRSSAEGGTFGMGDLLAGYTNTLMNDAANVVFGSSLKQRGKGMADYLKHLVVPTTAKDSEDFKYGRKEFVEEQENFAKDHPVLSGVGELVGGLASGVGGAAKVGGAKLLTKLGKTGTAVATGALSGGAYGFGSGATADGDKLDPINGAKESAKGTFLGGAFGAVSPIIWKQAGKIAHNMNKHVRAYKQLSKSAKGKLEESIEKNVPLIDIADKRALRVISGADKADMDASEMLADYANARMQKVKSNTEQVLDEIFGDKGYDSVLKKRHETAQKIAEPLYDKVFRVPKVKIELDPMAKLVAEELKSNPYSAQALKGYPDNSFRFLDAVKRGLDYKIKAIQTGIEQGKLKPADGVVLGDLMKSRADLLAKLDKVNPNYKIARSVAEQGFKFEEGAKAGQRAFLDPSDDIISKVRDMGRSGAKPDFAALRKRAALLKGQGVAEKRLAQIDLAEQIINSATEAEKAGYKMGMGQALRKLLEGGGADWENTPRKLFNPNRVRKLQSAGIDLKKQLPKIESEMKTADNLRGLFRGSQTAERQMDIGEIPTTLSGLATKGAKKLLSKAFVVSPKDIARMSIDPGYAAIMRAKAGRLPTGNYVDISGAGGAFSNIAGPLTSREKVAYRKSLHNNFKENIRGTSVPNSDVNGGKIIFNQAGIDKAFGSASNKEKLDLLQKAPELTRKAKKLPITYSDPNISTFVVPTMKDGVKDAATITIEQHQNMPAFFHNINESDYFLPEYQKKRTFMRSGLQFRGKGPKDSIANEKPSVKGKNETKKKKSQDLNFRDLLILLQRPYNLGQQGAIGGKNLNKGDE